MALPDETYLNKIENFLKEKYAPVEIKTLPKGLSFFSTEQLITRYEDFVPEGVLTREAIFETMEKLGFELAEISPFKVVWVLQDLKD